MKTLINKMTSAVSNAVLFAAAIVMAGLGFALVGTLALFGVLALGVALLAAPFVGRPDVAPQDENVQTA